MPIPSVTLLLDQGELRVSRCMKDRRWTTSMASLIRQQRENNEVGPPPCGPPDPGLRRDQVQSPDLHDIAPVRSVAPFPVEAYDKPLATA